MNNKKEIKRELLTPLFLEAGAALHECQGFEYGLALFLYQISRLNLIEELEENKMQAIMENVEKKTAGDLIKMLKKYIMLNPDQEKSLSDGLKARNTLIHRVMIDNVEKYADPEGRKELIKEIRKLRKLVNAADAVLRGSNLSLSKYLDGVDLGLLEKEINEKLLSEWLDYKDKKDQK